MEQTAGRGGGVMNVMYDIELKRLRWSDEKFLVDPILVGNLLTDEWKALPHMPHLSSGNKKPILVQLVMDEDTKCYKVVLVCRDKYEGALAANCYNSGTGGWSNSGLVYGYGGSHDWLSAREEDPCIFNCTTNMLFKLRECSTIRGNGYVKKLSMVKDCVFVLHRWGHDEYKVLEYTWDSSAADLQNLSTIDSTLPTGLPSNYDLHLFSSSGLVLIFGDNREKGEYHSQLTRLYDSSTKEWHSLAWEEGSSFTTADLFSLYMSELRWDAGP